MASHWDWYVCSIHGRDAVVQVDLSYGRLAPLSGFEALCWVFVPLREPDPSGLATQRETPRLEALEKELVPLVTRTLSAAYVARATTHGRREFYFYARSADGLQELVRGVFARFPEYGCDAGAQKDAAWSHFLNVLFPAPHELQLMHTRQEVERLRKGGATPAPRRVRHFVWFADWKARADFRAHAESVGFATEESAPDAAGPVQGRPFRLVLVRDEVVEHAAMAALVSELFERAAAAQGEYDGWETDLD